MKERELFHRRGRKGRWGLVPWLGAALLIAALPASAADDEFDTSMAQARVFLKKEWYREAVKELRRAVSTETGQKSFKAHLLLAETCFKAFDLRCSFNYAESALALAQDSGEKNEAQGMMDYLTHNFGKVEFKAGDGELSEGYLELKPLEPILDRAVKRYYEEKVKPLANQRRSLPWIMYLPALRYSLYAQEFTVPAGKEIVIEAGFTEANSAPRPEPLPPPPEFEGMGVALQFRLGAGIAFSDLASGDMAPGGVADLSVHKTMGDLLALGAFVRFGYDLGPYADPGLFGGLLVSGRLPINDRLAFVPALGYGAGSGPVYTSQNCALDSSGGQEEVVCEDPDLSGSVEATMPTFVHGPALRLELSWEWRRETRILAAYGGLHAQYGLAGRVLDGMGHFTVDESTSIPYRVSDEFSVHPLRLDAMIGFNLTF